MAKAATSDVLKAGQKVVALVDLRGTPRGSVGRVTMVSGVTWTRYWVDFENGTSHGVLDRSKVATPAEWKVKKDLPVGATAEVAADGGGAVAGGGGGGESVGGIPAHLLERSKKARERLAAKAAG